MALWTPAEISTALWLDAADSSTLFDSVSGGNLVAGGGAIARWEDKSGNIRHATQVTAIYRPTRQTAAQNSLDICRLSRAFSQSLSLTSTAANILRNKPYGSIFAVTKWNFSIGADQTVLNISRSGNAAQLRLGLQLTIGGGTTSFRAGARRLDTDVFTGAASANNSSYNLLESRANYSAGNLALWVNATQTASAILPSSGNTSDTNSDVVEIGQVDVNYLNADIGEIVVLDYVPTQDINERLEGYLAWKWGLQGNLPANHPYKNAAPTKGGLATIIASHYAALGI